MSEITRYPLFWPDNVARTEPYRRSRPMFADCAAVSAINLVKQEINRLNGRRWDYVDDSVIFSTNLRVRNDGHIAAGQGEPADTGAAVYFKLVFRRGGKLFERPCVLTCDRWNKVSFNLKAIAKDIEAQRARERWGCTNLEQAFRGYVAIPEKCGGKSWWDELGVSPSCSEDELNAAYRAKAKLHHPDIGGDRANWEKIQTAYEQGGARFKQ
jgi:hypothetical protein